MQSSSHAGLTQLASIIYSGFLKYNDNYIRITKRSKSRFERRDSQGAQKDLIERIELYDKAVKRTRSSVDYLVSTHQNNLEVWEALKSVYWERVNDTSNGEFSKTFFNSVHRDYLRSLDISPSRVSDTTNVVSSNTTSNVATDKNNYLVWGNLRQVIEQIVDRFKFDTNYLHPQADIDFFFNSVISLLDTLSITEKDVRRIEVLSSFFFQSGRAFLVGKIVCRQEIERPLVVAYVNRREGVSIEAILTNHNDVSILFGFSRSYFMVDLEPIEGVVDFLSSILPNKPIDEIYTVLGRARQGKTERARALNVYLKTSSDRFQHAPGIRGMVMLVFTLPGYSLVFKIIKDDFGHNKNITRNEVKEKYKLVFNHDRAGRLIDTQEFRNIEFPIHKFEKAMLEDMLQDASETVRIVNDKVVIDHLYTERKLIPLDIFLREKGSKECTQVIIDYGQAIKDLALTNIFPGDFLLKNFGVSRQGRVIFYDYDELCLSTECNFRSIPEVKYREDELRPNDWFHVGKNDVFPQEFIKFLALDRNVKQAFLDSHGEILTAKYWLQINLLHKAKKAPDVSPYYNLRRS